MIATTAVLPLQVWRVQRRLRLPPWVPPTCGVGDSNSRTPRLVVVVVVVRHLRVCHCQRLFSTRRMKTCTRRLAEVGARPTLRETFGV